ncbi:hypothetical protein RHA1_ro10132 (plasmid) [Rhodococcus jostii RHA1]|uniref:Uncharacterized protein n=1 Tax=Rhodococcus jostii (strain RHA1) TaxID=101510 RepID=Q0RWL1_RHOJR|nr:hypothetical protein RHA1_ro10132 [Rhodococcus jostii RHA1]
MSAFADLADDSPTGALPEQLPLLAALRIERPGPSSPRSGCEGEARSEQIRPHPVQHVVVVDFERLRTPSPLLGLAVRAHRAIFLVTGCGSGLRLPTCSTRTNTGQQIRRPCRGMRPAREGTRPRPGVGVCPATAMTIVSAAVVSVGVLALLGRRGA